MNNTLSLAEQAMLAFWHDYVRSYSPHLLRYDPAVHTLNRTRLFYLMTEDMIAYLKQCGISNYTEVALNRMDVTSGTLTNWRQRWGKLSLDVTSGTLTNWRQRWGKLSRIVHHLSPQSIIP